MERGVFMRKTETKQSDSVAQRWLALLLGALLALGLELMILLLGSFLVSGGILREDSITQVTAAACLIGCFIGGGLVCSRWRTKRFIAGLLTGAACFLLILLVSLLSGDSIELGVQGMVELVGCLIGGGLAGILGGRSKKKKRKIR